MDTKPLEKEAVSQITALLLKYGFKCADLSFDEDGADLFLIKKEERGTDVYWKCLRCQAKGRDVSRNSSNVRIPESYVRDDFLVFVYVKPEDVDSAQTYLYTAGDIQEVWGYKNGEYVLYLPKDFVFREENAKYLFNKSRREAIDELLKDVDNNLLTKDIKALTEADFYYRMWQKTGGLPPVEYLFDLFSNDNMSYLMDTEVFIFMLCASVVKNYDIFDQRLSIDWTFDCLKQFKTKEEESVELEEGRKYSSDVAIAFIRTFVRELVSTGKEIAGYHLHIADDEEAIDAYVMRNGKFWVKR